MCIGSVLGCVLAVVVVGGVAPVVAEGTLTVQPGSFTVVPASDQAGAHPDLTISVGFAENATGSVGGLLRNAEVVVPLGYAGYPPAVKTCNPVQLQLGKCPVGSQIGTLELAIQIKPGFDIASLVPLFNMLPSPDQTAVYGWALLPDASGEIVLSVGPDYRVRARATDIFSIVEIVRQSLTVWGVPASEVHNAKRGSNFKCQQFFTTHIVGEAGCGSGGFVDNENQVPYLVNPTQCTGEPLQAELRGVTTWAGEELAPVTTDVGPFTGCESLKFAPSIAVAPELTQATSPTGYEVDLQVPQSEGAEGLATPDLKDVVVKLPAGVVLSPSAANGLEACTEAQVGLGSESPVECPSASRVGTGSVLTPALSGELKGTLYLGGPPSSPITKPPFTLYLVLEGKGVLVKIRGTVSPDPVTGRLTTVFDRNPELPVSEVKLHLNGGSRAPQANPSVCGSYFAESVMTPWSSPFTPDARTFAAPFEITGCQPPRFDPSFDVGTTSNQAGGYSPLSVTFSREDTDEDLNGLTISTPPGVSGNLSNVPLCGEPQAAEGTCSASSQIGELTAGAGPGPEPVFIKGGRVFLTGPYDGAPFGLTIDVPEHPGPFDFGTGACDCEVVRATVNVDPRTAALTVTNGSLPTIKDGIPLQVKEVNVDVNRPEFIFNPTSCEPMSVDGTMSSTQGMLAQVQSHFQVTNCAALAFKPGFQVSTSGHTSRVDGASLHVSLTLPAETGKATEANVAKVKVSLPKQLPSPLKTLQKACTEAVFAANPKQCPVASQVGEARVSTPLLAGPLTGTAYFVSHGGAKYPELIIVLVGEDGVTVQVHGETFISKQGITSATFNTVPDVPFSNFELTLPEREYPALTANGNLCKGTLLMPTEFVAQNGAKITQSTKIAVTGCPEAKKAAHKKKGRKKRKGKGKSGGHGKGGKRK